MAKINQKRPRQSAMELVAASHENTGDPAQAFQFNTSKADAEEIARYFKEHQERVTAQDSDNSPFFEVNGTQIYGSNNHYVKAGAIPVFRGAALDLDHALMMGKKRWFQKPSASGSGAMLALFPHGINSAMVVSLENLELSENKIEGRGMVHNSSLGNSYRFEPTAVKVTDQAVVLEDVAFTTDTGKDETIKEITVTQDGMFSSKYDGNTLASFVNYQAPPVVKQTVADQPATTTDPTTTDPVTTNDPALTTTDQPAVTTPTEPAQVVEQAQEQEEITPAVQEKPEPVVKELAPAMLRDPKGTMLYQFQHLTITTDGDDVTITATKKGGTTFTLEGVSAGEAADSYTADSLVIPKISKVNTTFSELTIQDGIITASKVALTVSSESLKEIEDAESPEDAGVDHDTAIGDDEDAQDELQELVQNYLIGYAAQKVANTKVGEFASKHTDALTDAVADKPTDLIGSVQSVLGMEGGIKQTIIDRAKETKDNSIFFGDGTTSWKDLISKTVTDGASTENDEEETEDKTEASNKVSVGAAIPIFPFINFKVGAYASYGVAYKQSGEVTGLNANLSDKKLVQDPEKGVGITYGIDGAATASIGAQISLEVGADALLNLQAMLEASLRGKATAKGTATAYVKVKPDHTVELLGSELKAEGNLGLTASLDASINLNVLIWSKELYSINLAEKELGSVTGSIEASKMKGDRKWTVNPEASYKTLLGTGKNFVKDQKQVEKMLEGKEEKNLAFEKNKEQFDQLVGKLAILRQMFQGFQDENQPVLIHLDENSIYYTLNSAILDMENAFLLQQNANQSLIANSVAEANQLKQHAGYQQAVEKKQYLEQNMSQIKQLRQDSLDVEKHKAGLSGLKALNKSANQNDFLDTTVDADSVKEDAIKRSRSKEGIISYEKERQAKYEKKGRANLKKLKKGFQEKRPEMLNTKQMVLNEDTSCNEMYELYRSINSSNLEQNYIQVMGAPAMKLYARMLQQEKGDEKDKHLDTHEKRLQSLDVDYQRLRRTGQSGYLNKVFYDKYCVVDKSFGESIFNKQVVTDLKVEHLSNKQLDAFSQHYGRELKLDRILTQKSRFESRKNQLAELTAKESLTEQEKMKVFTLKADQETAFKTAKDQMGKDTHKMASKEDYQKVLKHQAKLQQIVDQTKPKDDGTKPPTEYEVLQRELLDRQDAAMRLIEFEKSHKNNPKMVAILQQAQASYTASSGKEDADNTAEAKRRLAERNKKIGEYFAYKKNDRVKGIYDDMVDRSDTSAMFNDSEITGYEGENSKLSTYEMMHKFGGTNQAGKSVSVNTRHELVRKEMEKRELTQDDTLNFYDYQIHSDKKKHTAYQLQQALEQGKSYGEMQAFLAQNKDVQDDYLKYIKKNAYLYLTPDLLMSHEEARVKNYSPDRNTNLVDEYEQKTISDEAFAKTDFAKQFVKKNFSATGKDSLNLLTYNQAVTLETASMEAASQKHILRIQQLESGQTKPADYEGQRMKSDSKLVDAMTRQLLSNPEYLADQMIAQHEKALENPTTLINDVDQRVKELLEMSNKAAEQMRVCQTIIDNASNALTKPKAALTDAGYLSILDQIASQDQLVDDQQAQVQQAQALQNIVDGENT